MTSFDQQIAAALGVKPGAVPAPPAPKAPATTAPSRPEPVYEFTLDVCRYEYGSVTVNATSVSDATSNYDDTDIYWSDYGDIEVNNWEKSDEPTNQDDLDEWDWQYGTRFDHDGDPKCSECLDCCAAEDLTTDPADDERWYCAGCFTVVTGLPLNNAF